MYDDYGLWFMMTYDNDRSEMKYILEQPHYLLYSTPHELSDRDDTNQSIVYWRLAHGEFYQHTKMNVACSHGKCQSSINQMLC